MGLEEDLPPGEQMLTLFRPFLEDLAASKLSPKTIRKHVDNMWARAGNSSGISTSTLLCERSQWSKSFSK
jgi:hypothetical protein